MSDLFLSVEERKDLGGGKVERLRGKGYIPAVIYGKEIGSKAIQIKTPEFRELLKNGKNVVFNVELEEGKTIPAIIKDMQHEILKSGFMHVDLQQISLTEKLTSSIQIKIIGQGKAEKGGGLVVQQLEEVLVESLPQDIPEYFEVDVSELAIGKNLTVADLDIPKNVTVLTASQDVIVIVTTIKEEKEEEATDDTGEEVTEQSSEDNK